LAKKIIYIPVITFLLIAYCNAGASAVEVRATVDNSSPIYAASPFSFSVVVENGDSPDSVDLQPLKDFSPSGPSVQNRTSIVNGKTSSSVILTYQLTAPAKGSVTIPAISVTIAGRTYTTNPVDVTVAQPGTTKQLDIEANFSTDECYVGQPVVYSVSFYIWTDIAANRGAIANVTLDVPILKSDAFYVEDSDEQGNQNSQTIILIVNGQKEIFYQDRVNHNGVDCVRLTLSKVLIAKKPGAFTVQPSTVGADLGVARANRSRDEFFGDFFGNQYEYKRYSASSTALELNISDLPQQTKPADFYGLVGNYTIEAQASPVKVNVGDPISLIIKVGGERYLAPVQWPDLKNIADFVNSFKIPAEHSDGKVENGYKVFTQTIRANNEKIKEIPSIPLSYFDSKKGQYVTIQSEPIPLEVSPTKVVTQADIEGTSVSTSNKEIEAVKVGISANYTSPDVLKNQHFSFTTALVSIWFFALWLLPFCLLIIAVISKLLIGTSPQRKIIRRKKNAYSNALKSLKSLDHFKKVDLELTTILKEFIADKFQCPAVSLTAQDCRELIYNNTNDADIAEQFKMFMEDVEMAAYSPTSYDFSDEKRKQIIELLGKIEKKYE
jgi:hypothetical protein